MKSNDLQRIEHIKGYCEDIADAILVFGRDYDVFENNVHYMNTVSMSLMQIGELAGKLSAEFLLDNPNLWDQMKLMRNWFAHNYKGMNSKIIWDTAIDDIPALQRFCEEILARENTGD